MDEITELALQRISVQPPYFALEDLRRTGHGSVTAVVPAAPPKGFEAGPVDAAQASRHLAILGSCAAAMARDDADRHHYLATSAHMATIGGAPDAAGEPLLGEAVATWVDGRTARALTKLTTRSGTGIQLLDVEYTVLTPRLFDRLHRPAAGERAPDSPSRTISAPEPTATGARLDFGPIPTSMCAGHFPGHPAAPVAIVMGELARTAGAALRNHTGRHAAGYRVQEGRVVASQLAQAGQHMVLEATHVGAVPGGHVMQGTASADGQAFGEMTVTLSETVVPADAAAA